MEFPCDGTRVKHLKLLAFVFVLVYFISAGAGNQAIILAKRCSVMPLKCVCCVISDLILVGGSLGIFNNIVFMDQLLFSSLDHGPIS
jgi:hypothetical protein